MPESRMIRYVTHEQALRMKGRLDHAIAMIRAELEEEPGTDIRGVDAELAMLLVRTAAMMGMDLTNGAAKKVARLEAELARAKIDSQYDDERRGARISRSAPLEIDRERFLANGSHNGTQTVDAFATAERSYARHTHPVDCGCSLCEGAGA